MRLTLLTLTAFVAWHGGAIAQQLPGDPVAGHRFAQEFCAECHDVELEWDEMAAYYGPAFVDIASSPTATEMSLKVFLRTPHREMPNFILTDQQVDDVISYILTLKEPRD